jgi:Transposase DDE domain
VPRSVHEAARDAVRRLAGTPEYLQSRRERKKVEMLFAHLKRILRLNRLRLRGPSGARVEFLLAAIAQNLRKLTWLVEARPACPIPERAREPLPPGSITSHLGRPQREAAIRALARRIFAPEAVLLGPC